ncbi:Predicted peptidase [Alteromonadaceae bacterium Bs31]|nr:Predicted peptidase [Alteromonadaceae bacterium Bs31]
MKIGKLHMVLIFAFICLACVLALLALSRYTRAQQIPNSALALAVKMQAHTFTFDKPAHTLPYRFFVPKDISEKTKKPLILVLQTAYGRGDNNLSQLDASVRKLVAMAESHMELSSFILAPQCPKHLEWIDSPAIKPPFTNIHFEDFTIGWREQALRALLKELLDSYPIDEQRIYIVGGSMGATGAWSMLYRFPDLFAAGLIMNGRSDPSIASVINTPLWVFHGAKDSIAPVSNSVEMSQALNQAGNKAVKLTILEDAGHNISKAAVNKHSLDWLFRQVASVAN